MKVEVLEEIDVEGVYKLRAGAIAFWEIENNRLIFKNADVAGLAFYDFAAFDDDLLIMYKDLFKIGDGSLELKTKEEINKWQLVENLLVMLLLIFLGA